MKSGILNWNDGKLQNMEYYVGHVIRPGGRRYNTGADMLLGAVLTITGFKENEVLPEYATRRWWNYQLSTWSGPPTEFGSLTLTSSDILRPIRISKMQINSWHRGHWLTPWFMESHALGLYKGAQSIQFHVLTHISLKFILHLVLSRDIFLVGSTN